VAELPARIEALQSEVKRLQREVAQLRQRLASGAGSQAAEMAQVDGVAVALQRVDAEEKDLLVYADHALNRPDGPGVAVVVGGRRLAVKVAPSLAARLEAAGVVRAFTAVAGGKGGGRGPVGEGGGIDPARVPEAFQAVQAWIGERLKESS
jgi:alanyl-tRNA synthetase